MNESNINKFNYYSNMIQTMRYNNNINNKLKQINEEKMNNNINNYIDLLQKQNISLQQNIKKFKREIILRDNEIDGYKEKVKALLNQVKDKNNDLDKKRNVILKLNEEKEINNVNQAPPNNINNINISDYNLMKIQLQLLNREKAKLLKDNKYLKEIIQKLKLNQNKKNNFSIEKHKNSKFLDLGQNLNENEKSSDFGNNNKIYENYNSDDLIIYKIEFSIKGNKKEENDDKLLLQKDLQIKKLKKIIEELKNNSEINEIKNKNKYYDSILKNKENKINELSKNINDLKEENTTLKNNLNEKIKELNEIKIRNDLLQKDEKYNNIENEDLKIKLNKISEEKVNKERIIEELNEDIENLKEMNEYNKKEINEKNSNLEKMSNAINELENKYKVILLKNEELKKDNDKLYSDNVKLKKNVNKLNEDLENEQNLKEDLENKNNKIEEKNAQLSNDKKELVEKMISIEDNNNKTKNEIEKLKKINDELMEQVKNYQNNNYSEQGGLNIQSNIKNSLLNTPISTNNGNNIKENEKEEDIKFENSSDNNNMFDVENNKNNDNNELKKENNILQKRIIQLNECIQDLNNQLNSINTKYQEQKKENHNLKEASKALLEQQKNYLEEKDRNEFISPDTHYIISKNSYNKLKWYLISIINPNSKNENEINKYKNYKWVTEKMIPQSELNKYNKFDDKDNKIDDFIINENKIQNNQNQNKTTNSNLIGGKLFLNKVLNNDKNNNLNKSNSNNNYTNKFNANSCLAGELVGDVGKYKNLLDKLNDYGEREIKLQNEISKLRNQLKDKENFQAGMNNIKDISQKFESNFIDDDKDDKNVIELLSNNKKIKKEDKKMRDDDNFLNILNDVPGNESDLDVNKGLQNLTDFLKKTIKEKEKIINDLIGQIKELFKELKWSTKNNKTVSKILEILGYSPDIIKIIVDNRKRYNFDFDLELKR